MTTHAQIKVSVPLRGKGIKEPFPTFVAPAKSAEVKVSVPLRGKGIKELGGIGSIVPISSNNVSVPLRGKGIKELRLKTDFKDFDYVSVSVPLRGKGIKEHCSLCSRAGGWLRFPSPCGEKVLRNRSIFNPLFSNQSTFPSPCGEKVLRNSTPTPSPTPTVSVSVPLRGKGIKEPTKPKWT